MDEEKKCCGNCSFCVFDDGEWNCNNEESENYGLYVDYNDDCDEHEERQD